MIMSIKAALISEFENRVFKENYLRIFKCLSMLEEEQLWLSPKQKIAPIGNLILHLCGNARQWVLSGVGELPDNRDRDQEFEIQRNISKTQLIFLMENLRLNLKYCLDDLNEKQLYEPKTIQGFESTNFSAIIHVIEHFSYHTGQITTLTKWITGKDTGYYSEFDLNVKN